MPIYMDRHYTEGASSQACAVAHGKDLETQGKYGVRFITYWFDEVRCIAFCLRAERGPWVSTGRFSTEIFERYGAIGSPLRMV